MNLKELKQERDELLELCRSIQSNSIVIGDDLQSMIDDNRVQLDDPTVADISVCATNLIELDGKLLQKIANFTREIAFPFLIPNAD